VPWLVHDLQKLSLLKNSMKMGYLVVTLFYPEMQKHGDAIQVDTDTENKTFTISVSKGGCNNNSPDSDSNDIEIGNEEV
jgi:hypothetical protein